MLVGLPGSGKSTKANAIKCTLDDITIHSSDSLRKEMFGDENINSKETNKMLFEELHRRIRNDLNIGRSVIYDATNINRKRRIAFLHELQGVNCLKECELVMAPYTTCLTRNNLRERSVPEKVLKRMYMSFQPPHKSEGWDSVSVDFNCRSKDAEKYHFSVLFDKKTGIDNYNQNNHHHTLTLGEHCRKVADFATNKINDVVMNYAALLHDEGKPFTATNLLPDGTIDKETHYYGHNCVGAYNSFFYCKNGMIPSKDMFDIATLIYFHMTDLTVHKTLRKQLGEDLYKKLEILVEADRAEH